MAVPALQIERSPREALYSEIVDSLESLPEVLRVIFVRSHYQAWSPQQISRELGIPEATIERMLEDANQIFYRNLHQFHFNIL